MSSYPAGDPEDHWESRETENKKEDEEDEDESAAESEEVDQLLSSYRRNPHKKRSSSSIRRLETDSPSPVSTTNQTPAGDDVVVVAIEHHEKPIDQHKSDCHSTSSVNNYSSQNESSCSSTSLLRDLLPHLAESNMSTVSGSPTSPDQAILLSKTYTEPTSLSGLLRQVGNRLFVHYPAKMLTRHSKISPTTSMHCKLDDCGGGGGDGSSQMAMLTTATSNHPVLVVDKGERLETGDSDGGTVVDANVRRAMELGKHEKQQRRLPAKPAALCKRCPHCRKTCLLRKMSASENIYKNTENGDRPPYICACRICMVLESVESALSSPIDEADTSKRLPRSSTSTVGWSTFSTDATTTAATTADGSSSEGLERPRQASLGGRSLELGVFCDECNVVRNTPTRTQEPAAMRNMNEISSCCDRQICQQKSREQGIQVNSSSMVSIATASSFGGPVCRICHSPGDKLEPLISPCRCLGTLKYVHASCLLHWLDISSRKLRRPPHCELCGYRYQRHKTMKFRRIQWPTCSRRDKMYHLLFLFSVLVMIACAALTIVCFKADRGQPRTAEESVVLKKATGGGAATVGAGGNGQVELSGQEVITLVCGILFFCAFFVAMYVQVKAQATVYKLCVRFWTMNQEWHVEEYRRERDAEYWRQRHKEQERRRASQLSSSSTTAAIHTPQRQRRERSPRSFSVSSSSSTSFRAEMLN